MSTIIIFTLPPSFLFFSLFFAAAAVGSTFAIVSLNFLLPNEPKKQLSERMF